MKIDSFFKLPSDGGIDIPRNGGIGIDGSTITIKFTLEVVTFYPSFTVNTEDYEMCDNDDSIDWEFLGVEKPNVNSKSKEEVKRAYWYNNLLDNRTKEEIIKEKEDNRDNEINNME